MAVSNLTNLSQIQSSIFQDTNLNEQKWENILNTLEGKNIDYGDLYAQTLITETIKLEEDIIKNFSVSSSNGVGVRVCSGEKTGFSYCQMIDKDSILHSAQFAKSFEKYTQPLKNSKIENSYNQEDYPLLYSENNLLTSWSNEQKVVLLNELNAYIKKQNSKIIKVNAFINSNFEQVYMSATDGSHFADIRPMVVLGMQITVQDGNKIEQMYRSLGGRYGYDNLIQNENHFKLADDCIRQALLNLQAKEAPAGSFPVILNKGNPGVLLHEAVGHGLEADFNRKNLSSYSGKMEQKVASDLCTIIDDGTINQAVGSLNSDDEGVPSHKNVLIENGILKGYMYDKMSARIMGMKPSGNGRRESYQTIPMPRMTNTYMLAGNSEQEQMISSIEKGVFASHFGGGQVDITSGNFVFYMSEAYMIEKGKITYPIKKATLIGNGPEVMQNVSMVGNDFELESDMGYCGKDGQTVPVGLGQPSLKIDNIVIGGTDI